MTLPEEENNNSSVIIEVAVLAHKAHQPLQNKNTTRYDQILFNFKIWLIPSDFFNDLKFKNNTFRRNSVDIRPIYGLTVKISEFRLRVGAL